MTLAIDHFITRCRVSPRAAIDRHRIDRVVRTEFVDSCACELASVFRGHTGVVRIRRLSVKLALPRKKLGDLSLGRQWAAAFAALLKRALALPDGQGPTELRRFESRADWLADAIAAVLQGDPADRWEFAELPWLATSSLADAVSQILDLDPGNAAAILLRLRQRGRLDELLIGIDEVALERLMRRLDGEFVAASPVSIEDLIEIAGGIVQRQPAFGSERLVSRRRALALWAALADDQKGRWTPRRVADALSALDVLTAAFTAQSGENVTMQLLHRINASVDGDCVARDVLARLTTTLTRLAESFPSHAAAGKRIGSGVAGLLLLVPSIIRLGWPQAMETTALWGRHGPRALTYVLAAVGQHLLENRCGGDILDPGVAIFAGWMGEPDLAGFRRFNDDVTSDDCRELSRALGISSAADAGADWHATIAAAADRLISEFASRIRGFGRSSREFVVQKLLAVSGEIAIEERRLSVTLAPCPFHVALHVASAFETVNAVSWLGFRDLVFHPGVA